MGNPNDQTRDDLPPPEDPKNPTNKTLIEQTLIEQTLVDESLIPKQPQVADPNVTIENTQSINPKKTTGIPASTPNQDSTLVNDTVDVVKPTSPTPPVDPKATIATVSKKPTPNRADFTKREINETLAADATIGSQGADADGHDEFMTATQGGSRDEKIGRYEIKRILGEGAFGKVFEALDPRLERIVAVKVAKAVAGKTQTQRFLREARAAAQLRHPNIIPVYEYGQVDGQNIIVYEFVEGETLRSLNTRKEGLPLDEVIRIVREIAEGLDYAHSQGIIHRDMKPDNVMIDPKGGVHIADFGCARIHRDDTEETMEGTSFQNVVSMEATNRPTDLTEDGSILGTPMYMSPEQASGNSRTADGRTDIWSLGVMFYEMVSATRPFQGSLTELLYWICNKDPKPLREIDPKIPLDIEIICHKCLQRDLGERFLKAGELADELERIQKGEPIVSRKIGPVHRSWMWAKRNRAVASLMTAVAVTLLLGTIISSVYAINLNREQNKHAFTQIGLLKNSEAKFLPDIFKSLGQYKSIEWKLNGQLKDLDLTHDEKLRIRMAQLTLEKNDDHRAEIADELRDELLATDADLFFVLRDCLEFRKQELTEPLWGIALNDPSPQKRFQASVALALYDSKSAEWSKVAPDVAGYLTSLNQIEMSRWLPSVAPIREKLKTPLFESFDNQEADQDTEAERASVILARLFSDQPDWLIQTVLPIASPVQASHVIDALKNEHAVETLKPKLADMVSKSTDVKQQANFVVALVQLDKDYRWNHFTQGDDPSLATELIERIGPASTPFETLFAQLKQWSDPKANLDADKLSGILLAIGQFRRSQILVSQKANLQPVLIDIFSKHPDARVHSSARWLFGKLRLKNSLLKAEATLKQERPMHGFDWHIDSTGNTFVIFDRVDSFKMGLNKEYPTNGFLYDKINSEPEHAREIPRRFGISINEVTIQQYEEFERGLIKDYEDWIPSIEAQIEQLKSQEESDENTKQITTFTTVVNQLKNYNESILKTQKGRGAEDPNLPISNITYIRALMYCSWLSEPQDDLECGLPSVRDITKAYLFASQDLLNFKQADLAKTGYRLPTTSEWEYACRGRSRTLYPFGRDPSRLNDYAWFSGNSPSLQNTGLLKPGATGAFDMLGNAREWCLDYHRGTLPVPVDVNGVLVDFGPEFEKDVATQNSFNREIRGGSFTDKAVDVRPTRRTGLNAIIGMPDLGFRLARTYPAESQD